MGILQCSPPQGLPTSAPIGMLLAATHLHSSGTEPADLLKPLLLCCNPTAEFYGRDTGNAWGNADTSAPSPVEGCFALVCFVLACHGNVTNLQNFLVLAVEKRNTMLKSQAALLQVKIDSAKSSELVLLLKTVNCSSKPMQQDCNKSVHSRTAWSLSLRRLVAEATFS